MARKAVQGYPEKSYYDNTRYLGIVATTDPLNEGLFKHMVNFDVSDTGQSVTPREGFLTTTLKNDNAIFLSNQTIIFRDNNLGDYILFDIKNNVGYVAEISAYKAKDNNYYLPIKKNISTIDWNKLFTDVLIPNNSELLNYYLAYSTVENGVTLNSAEVKLAGTINEYRPKINVINETTIEHIYDEYGISRTLTKLSLTVTSDPLKKFEFIVQLNVKKEIVNGEDVYTLYIEGLTYMFEHPTIVSTERNLAVSKSIIPETFQTLYTGPSGNNKRPDGLISTLGNFIYIYDTDSNYVTNFIERNKNYNFTPYFRLNPAYVELNNNENYNNAWAYRFDLFNTSTDVNDKTKDVVYRSPWMRYSGKATTPVPVFSNVRRDSISLNNTNRTLNHYKDARYVIFLFPKTLQTTKTTSTTTRVNGAVTETTIPSTNANGSYKQETSNETFNNITSRQQTWYNTVLGFNNQGVAKVNDLKTFIDAITALDNTAYFYVYDLYSSASSGIFNPFDVSMSDNASASDIKQIIINKPLNAESAAYTFLQTGSQVIDLITTKNIFIKEHVVFKAFPFASNNEDTFTDKRHSFSIDTNFGSQAPIFYYEATNNAPTFTGYVLNTKIQNLYNSRVYNLASLNPLTWTLLSSATTTPLNINLVKNELYLQTGTSNWFRWDGENRALGATNSFIAGFTKLTTAPTNIEIQTITHQWVFSTLNYWTDWNNGISNGEVYRNVYNSFISGSYGFFERINNETIIQFSSDFLKNITNTPVITFTSSSRFDNQIPRYRSSIPGNTVHGTENEIVHVNSNGRFYRYVNGNWVTLIEQDENGAITFPTEPTPSAFIKDKLYFDTRTGIKYIYSANVDGFNGIFLIATTPNVEGFPDLNNRGFFEKGFNGIFYMKPFEDQELLDNNNQTKNYSDLETLKIAWDNIALKQTFNVQYTFDDIDPTYIVKTTPIESEQIQTSNNLTVFENSRLLLWNKNVLYISEEGRFYWFKERTKIEFAEEIVKALQYKQIILVFTTQHLYAVYRVETTVTQLNPATNQIEQNVTGVAWLKQIVLYNLLVKKEYADVIQIFNQMVLFYSEDGQLFMIRPSSQIDDQTRFSIQYFNKAANDILKNYEVYINERLASYGSTMRVKKDEIKIKALVSINFIKLIYYVPGVITYMLIYDVINNRYTAYDSLTFTNVFDKRFIESGDLFVTEQNNRLYFTFPFVETNIRDNYVDIAITNNFKKEGINCLIDTGNLNLNNHLHKRFRDLHVTFKNLNATNVLFNVETMIDEVIAKPFYDEQLQVIDSNNISYYVTVKKENNKDLIELVDVNQISEQATDVVKYSLTNNLFENNNMLMDFSEYTSSKLLTHRTSVLGLGKVFRLKLQFISKGLYKLQGFGIIYKERRI